MNRIILMGLLGLLGAMGVVGESCVMAQGEWAVDHVKADELKGQAEETAYVYKVDGMGAFVCWGFDKYQFRLWSSEAQFDIDSAGGRSGVVVTVGIYNDNDELAEKFEMWLDKESNSGNRYVRTRDAGTMNNPVGQKGKVKKIMNVLNGGKCYVRILADRFETEGLDMRIYPYRQKNGF